MSYIIHYQDYFIAIYLVQEVAISSEYWKLSRCMCPLHQEIHRSRHSLPVA